LANRAVFHEALTSQEVDFVMGQASTEKAATADIYGWSGNRRPRQGTLTTVSGSVASREIDHFSKEIRAELIDKLFSNFEIL
jgi:hypothetical protein